MRNRPPERMLFPKHKEEHKGLQRAHWQSQLCGTSLAVLYLLRQPCPTSPLQLRLLGSTVRGTIPDRMPAGAETHQIGRAPACPKTPIGYTSVGCRDAWHRQVQTKGTAEAGAGRPENTEYYKYPCPLVELQNSGSKRQVTEHANCHTEGCGPTVLLQLGVVLHQAHYLSVRYGNRPSESLRSILAAVGCRRSPGSSLNPRPPIRDPERRLPLCQPLGIALPFIKPSFADASWKLWVPVGHGDSSQDAHCLCPCPGQYQWRGCRLGQQRLTRDSLGPGRWARSQPSMPVPGNLAVAGQGSTVGLPGSEVICGSLISFIEKHAPGRGWRLGRGAQKLEGVLLLLRSLWHLKRPTQMSRSRYSDGQGLRQQTIPVPIPPSFQSCLGGFASLYLSFFTCQQSSVASKTTWPA